MVLVAAACGPDAGDRVTGAPTSTGQVPTPAAARFCASWVELVKTDDDARAAQLLRDPPAEIADAVGVILESESAGDTNDEAVGEVMAWVEVNCNTDSNQRRVAPPVGTDLGGLTLCDAGTTPPVPALDASEADRDDAVLFGEADRADPYDGPMIGLFSTKAGEGGYAGDGDPTPVTVRGMAGDALPITVFQQTIVPELGTVIVWTEGGRDVGLFGRLWTKERTGELVALANRLELVDGRLAFPAGGHPMATSRCSPGQPTRTGRSSGTSFPLAVTTSVTRIAAATSSNSPVRSSPRRSSTPSASSRFRSRVYVSASTTPCLAACGPRAVGLTSRPGAIPMASPSGSSILWGAVTSCAPSLNNHARSTGRNG